MSTPSYLSHDFDTAKVIIVAHTPNFYEYFAIKPNTPPHDSFVADCPLSLLARPAISRRPQFLPRILHRKNRMPEIRHTAYKSINQEFQLVIKCLRLRAVSTHSDAIGLTLWKSVIWKFWSDGFLTRQLYQILTILPFGSGGKFFTPKCNEEFVQQLLWWE